MDPFKLYFHSETLLIFHAASFLRPIELRIRVLPPLPPMETNFPRPTPKVQNIEPEDAIFQMAIFMMRTPHSSPPSSLNNIP